MKGARAKKHTVFLFYFLFFQNTRCKLNHGEGIPVSLSTLLIIIPRPPPSFNTWIVTG